MTIDPGTLNRRVTVERYTATDGQWGTEYTWATYVSVWGALKYETVDEQFAADQAYTSRVVTFTVRYREDLTEVDRLVCLGVTYEILGISEIGNRDGLAIKARAIDPNA